MIDFNQKYYYRPADGGENRIVIPFQDAHGGPTGYLDCLTSGNLTLVAHPSELTPCPRYVITSGKEPVLRRDGMLLGSGRFVSLEAAKAEALMQGLDWVVWDADSGARVWPLKNAYKISYAYCGICGYQPQTNLDEPNYGPIRWWDPDDGWKVGTLCRSCREEYGSVQPKPEDYAYETTNGVCDVEDTDEDILEAL